MQNALKGNRPSNLFFIANPKKLMENTRKQRSDSASAATQMLQSASNEVQLPEGVELRNVAETTIWRQFTRARAGDAWRDFDLVLLAKVVRLESDIRKYQEMLDISGPLIKNKKETLIENPMLRVIDTLQRQQLAIIRSMSLTQTNQDPRTMNAGALDEKKALDTIKRTGPHSLLAQPIRH